MVELVKKNINSITETCRKMQLQSLYLFGSGTRDADFNEDSDLDFVFSFIKNKEGFPSAGFDYFDLLFALEGILGKKVDLVAEEKIRNRYFYEQVKKERIKLYEA
ncbi:MAG: nucleotidyltransferase family protein [Agriterribacter sp.]